MSSNYSVSRRLGILLAFLAVVGWMFVSAPATISAISDVVFSPTSSAVPSDTAIPTLSQDQTAQATNIVASSNDLQKLLNGDTYTTTQLAPWTDGNNDLIGASMALALNSPLNTKGTWPTIRYLNGNANKEYSVVHGVLTVANATSIIALVDLTTQKVVSLEPQGAQLGLTLNSNPATISAPSQTDQ